ncbi:3-ketodihydrosphingosine reductase gsl-3 [Pleurostoma richardsiae]|uniref:3-dehydrosphinganine reductase n=1 Tax=Pleurostoma richardsiae TaxID=41990 RepID=A0AA38VVH5_9PEZI|nr:3-ketodihydrosphingosine reductase gsl-3 [Pleurostoma richardsiae]
MGLFSRKNHMPVEGRTILITGGSDGMGRSAARQLAAKGANVIVVGRNVGRLEEGVGEMKAAAKSPHAQRFLYISADVSERDYAAGVIASAIAWNQGSPPDIVWCVAGVSEPMLFAEDAALPSLRRQMDVNFFGAAEMAHAILREWLSPSGPGFAEPRHLVFTASVLALYAIVGYAPYSPSKWAVRGLADTLAQEVMLYPRTPVRVHVVYPGTILSPGFEREQRTKPDVTLHLERDDPKQTPDEVASRAIAGLEAGRHFVTVGLLGEMMRWGVMGGSLRNNWVLDTLAAWFIALAWPIVHLVMHGDIKKFARERGHPATWPKKV